MNHWEITIKTENETLCIPIIRSKRKTLALQVTGNSDVIVRAPQQITRREAELFVQKNAEWIKRTRREMELRCERQKEMAEEYRIPDYTSLTPMEKNKIRRHIMERLKLYAPQMGVKFARVTVRDQKTRWGSCSSKGNLNFNYRLHYLPQELMDYVVVHELAHRIHMNHSREFWEVVAAFDADYKEHRKRLKEIRIY